jgi:hypothetical protein
VGAAAAPTLVVIHATRRRIRHTATPCQQQGRRQQAPGPQGRDLQGVQPRRERGRVAVVTGVAVVVRIGVRTVLGDVGDGDVGRALGAALDLVGLRALMAAAVDVQGEGDLAGGAHGQRVAGGQEVGVPVPLKPALTVNSALVSEATLNESAPARAAGRSLSETTDRG